MAPTTLTVFHFTDLHARLGAVPSAAPGIPGLVAPARRDGEILAGLAGIDALLQEELADHAGPALLVCCGDMFGTEVVHDREERGALTVQALGLLAKRASIPALWLAGNHDVDHGLDRLAELAPAAGMRLIGGNVAIDGVSLSDQLVRIEVAGVRLAVVSVTTPQIASEAPTGERDRIAAQLPVQAARAALAQATHARRAGDVDAVVALAHCFDGEDDAIARLGPDLVLGGHTHVFRSGRAPGGARREKAGCHGQALGRVVLRRHANRWRVDPERTALLLPDLAPPLDSPLMALAERAEAQAQQGRSGAALALCPSPIRGLGAARSSRPSPIGSAVAQGLLRAARRVSPPVHCAFINAGNIRAELQPTDGRITAADLRDVLAFGNKLVLVTAPPELVLTLLANAVVNLKLDRAGWLRTAGLRARIGADGAITDVQLESETGWVPLHTLARVRLATIDWLADGGHHYAFQVPLTTVKALGVASALWADALDPDAAVPRARQGLLVDDRFRQTDTRTVVDTLHAWNPGSVDWARERTGSSRR